MLLNTFISLVHWISVHSRDIHTYLVNRYQTKMYRTQTSYSYQRNILMSQTKQRCYKKRCMSLLRSLWRNYYWKVWKSEHTKKCLTDVKGTVALILLRKMVNANVFDLPYSLITLSLKTPSNMELLLQSRKQNKMDRQTKGGQKLNVFPDCRKHNFQNVYLVLHPSF